MYALDLARRGASVVVNDVGAAVDGTGAGRSVADTVVAEIRDGGGSAVASYDSVDSPAGGAAIVATAVDTFGRIDVVVSNAGIFEPTPFEAMTPEQWRRMLSVHLDGAFYVSQPAYVHMRRQGYGRFVFAVSAAGVFGQPDLAHYGAAKAGLLGLANVLATEGGPHGILANCVLPFAHSRMAEVLMGAAPADSPENGFLGAITPERVVAMVTYLASPSCRLTHHAFSAAAGRFARVFVGLADGWVAGTHDAATAEDVEANLDALLATERFSIPGSIYDEVSQVCDRLGFST